MGRLPAIAIGKGRREFGVLAFKGRAFQKQAFDFNNRRDVTFHQPQHTGTAPRAARCRRQPAAALAAGCSMACCGF